VFRFLGSRILRPQRFSQDHCLKPLQRHEEAPCLPDRSGSEIQWEDICRHRCKEQKAFYLDGFPRSETRIFHGPREQMPPGTRIANPPSRRSNVIGAPTGGTRHASPAAGGATVSSPVGGQRMMSPAPREGKASGPRVYEGERFRAPAPEGGTPGPSPSEERVFSPPAHDGETMHPPAGGAGGMRR